MNIKQLLAAAGLATLCSSPALALTFQGAVTQGATVATDYSGTGLVSFDIDFANLSAATLSYSIDAADLAAGPLSLNAILRNFAGTGIDGYALQLSAGNFSSAGSVVRQFGGSTVVNVQGGLVTLSFSPPEFLDVEIGNALGTTPGTSNWLLGGLQAGDAVSITVSVVPEPGTWALMLAGLSAVGFIARRQQRRG